jgi:hypothetical protein
MRHRVTGMSPHGVGQGTTGFARGAPLQSFFAFSWIRFQIFIAFSTRID